MERDPNKTIHSIKSIISKRKEASRSNLFQMFDKEYGNCGCGEKIITKYKMYIATKVDAQIIEVNKCRKCEEAEILNELMEKNRKEFEEIKLKKLHRMFDENSLINPKLKKSTLGNYHPTNKELEKAKITAIRYVDNFSEDNPVSLLMIGDYGTGKSHVSAGILKGLIEKGFSGVFISTPKLMTKIRSTYNKESEFTEAQMIDQLSSVSCLVLDDLGSEAIKVGDSNQHTWATSKIFEIIDNRIGKHTIYTTNYELPELQTRLGGRNFSRLMENVHIIKMYGEDFRLRDFK